MMLPKVKPAPVLAGREDHLTYEERKKIAGELSFWNYKINK